MESYYKKENQERDDEKISDIPEKHEVSSCSTPPPNEQNMVNVK